MVSSKLLITLLPPLPWAMALLSILHGMVVQMPMAVAKP